MLGGINFHFRVPYTFLYAGNIKQQFMVDDTVESGPGDQVVPRST